jgi:hypothetical protein
MDLDLHLQCHQNLMAVSFFFFFWFFFLLYYDVCKLQFVDTDEGDEFDVLPVRTLCTLL